MRHLKVSPARLALAICLTGALMGATAATASAELIYDNTPSSLPGNLPSLGYQANQTSEFGGQVKFAGTKRRNVTVRVLMSSWGCQSGTWNNNDCVSAPGSTFTHTIRLKIYDVNPDNSPGALLGASTQTLELPYRPSADATHCTGGDAGKWFDGRRCNNGFLTQVSFRTGVTVPKKAIISVAYDTSGYGAHPLGYANACNSTAAGCPYDSLNVALRGGPSVGKTPLPDDAYLDAALGSDYCDGGTGGTGTFRLDAGCWTDYQPAFQVKGRA